MAYMDKVARTWGNEFFGEDAMSSLTDSQVEEARCFAFEALTALTAELGKRPPDTAKELFCNYCFEHFM